MTDQKGRTPAAGEADARAQAGPWADWIGRTETREDVVATDRVAGLAATLGGKTPGRGVDLPPGWHWILFNSFGPMSEVGPDGHPRRGSFLPPVPLPRRMWAGGRITYPSALRVGEPASRLSEIVKISEKSGRRGSLVFVTVRHTLSQTGKTCVVEEHDIVYRDAPQAGAPAVRPDPAPEGATLSREVAPDPVLLFRYSALTLNGHRIHYDRKYVQNEEGYHDLVVHGPLLATLLQGLAVEASQGKHLMKFDYRGLSPIFVDAPFRIEAKPADGELKLWVRDPSGGLAMQATARVG